MEGTESDNNYPRAKPDVNSKSLENALVGASQKIENEIANLKNQIKTTNSKIEILTSKMHQLQQQTVLKEIHTHECQVVMEKIKDSNWSFNKEMALSLLKIKKPTPEILDISEKFMIVLDQKERNWKMFQASLRNYESLKALMDKFNPENIREENVDLILGLWKNYNTIQPKIAKISKGFCILFDWITSCMEFKIKKATLETVRKSFLEVQNKIREYTNSVAEKESLIITLEEKLHELKENPPKEELQKKTSLQATHNKTSHNSHSSQNSHHSQNNQEISSNSVKSVNKLNKMLSTQNSANLPSGSTTKKLAVNEEESEQSSCQNASCEVRAEAAQANTIISNTYRFQPNFGGSQSIRHEDMPGSSRKNSRVEKIYKIIANHDDRNKDNAVLTDSKIMFVKEKTVNNTPNKLNEAILHEAISIDIRQPLFEEDKTNSTYLNSLRNPAQENTSSKKKLFSTIGTNSGASIGINSLKHEESAQRAHITKNILTPRIEDRSKSEHNVATSARGKKYSEESGKNEEEDQANDQSFAACCKKGINRLFCS